MLAGGKSLRVSQSLSESLRLRQSERDQPGLRSCDVYLGNFATVRCPHTRRQISPHTTNPTWGLLSKEFKIVAVTSSDICSQLFLYSFLNGPQLLSTSTILPSLPQPQHRSWKETPNVDNDLQ